jgi:hypothetical protein
MCPIIFYLKPLYKQIHTLPPNYNHLLSSTPKNQIRTQPSNTFTLLFFFQILQLSDAQSFNSNDKPI